MSASKPPELEPWVKYIDEAKKTGKLDNKAFWREIGTEYIKRYPEGAYRMMNPQIWQLLKDNLDCRKIETVLDVGCGFGRIMNIMLTGGLLPNVKRIVGMDLSDGMLKEARKTVPRSWSRIISFVLDDFELDEGEVMYQLIRLGLPAYYDLVISAETMTSIPKQDEDRVKRFVDKMCSMSKKYVVNIDWYWDKERGDRKPQMPIYYINNYHWYNEHYSKNSNVLSFDRWKIKGVGEYVFIARLR